MKRLCLIRPLPLLTMRTIIQTRNYLPDLTEEIMGVLRGLIDLRVWEQDKQWAGFVKCCQIALPHSLPVLLKLPVAQLEAALAMTPQLKEPLISHAATRYTSVPLPTRKLLGLSTN